MNSIYNYVTNSYDLDIQLDILSKEKMSQYLPQNETTLLLFSLYVAKGASPLDAYIKVMEKVCGIEA